MSTAVIVEKPKSEDGSVIDITRVIGVGLVVVQAGVTCLGVFWGEGFFLLWAKHTGVTQLRS